MPTAKVFQSGNSQAIRLPKEFHFDTTEVEIFRRGEEVVLRERRRTGREVFDILAGFPEDFMAVGRDDRAPQEREDL